MGLKVCITLDDVIRKKTYQIGKIFKKNVNENIILENLDFSTNDFQKIFGFKDKESYEKFLYDEYSFEIFGEAKGTEDLIGDKINHWILKMEDEFEDGDFEVILSNTREFNQSIGCTYFFLSKIATRVRKVFFPKDSNDIWEECDVLVTADVDLLKSKPEGKISVKILTDYNKDCESDYCYDKLSDFLEDEKILKQ